MIELTDLRVPEGCHYAAGDGQRTFVTIGGTRLNYQDGDQMAAVDMRVQRVTTAALDGWRVTKNAWHYAIGQPGDKSTDGWIGFGGRAGIDWLRFRLARAGVVHWPTKEYTNVATASYDRAGLSRQNRSVTLVPGADPIYLQTVAEWTGVLPGVTLRWLAEGYRLKEEIVVTPAALTALIGSIATPLSETYAGFVFELDAGTARAVIDGRPQSIENGIDSDDRIDIMTDDLSELIAFMPLDYVYLESDPAQRIRLRRRFYRQGDQDYLIVGVRADSLAALAALDPSANIVFDPTFEDQPDSTTGQDCFIKQDDPNTNTGNQNLLWLVGPNGSSEARGLQRYDCSSITGGATCDSATWSAYTGFHNDADFEIYSLASGVDTWDEDQATWNNYKTSTAWPGSSGAKTSGTDYEAAQLGGDTDANYDEYHDFDLTASRIEDWFSASNTNYGLLTVISNAAGRVQYYSSNYGTAADRPKLTVEYSYPITEVEAGAAAVAPTVVLGSTTATPAAGAAGCAAVAGSILQASIPPTLIGYIGDIYLMSAAAQVSIALLVTDGDYWRLVDSGNTTEAIGASISRYSGYLTPE